MTRRRILARVAASLMCVAASVAMGSDLSAHPTALTHVLVTVNDTGAIDVVFTTVGEALVTKLEVIGRVRRATVPPDARARRRILDVRDVLIAKVGLRVDGTSVPLRLTDVTEVTDETGKLAIRLSGRVPTGATGLSWTTGLVSGTYPLAEAASAHEVLEGRRTLGKLLLKVS